MVFWEQYWFFQQSGTKSWQVHSVITRFRSYNVRHVIFLGGQRRNWRSVWFEDLTAAIDHLTVFCVFKPCRIVGWRRSSISGTRCCNWLTDWLPNKQTNLLSNNKPSNQPTNSLEQSLSWGGNSSLVSQEIPRILWIPNVGYRCYKSPPLLCIMSRSIHSTPTPTPLFYFLKIHF